MTPALAVGPLADSDSIGEVVNVTGTVRATQPDGLVRKLEFESLIFAHDTLVSSLRSNIEIMFKDGTILAQGPEAQISLDDFVYSTNKSLSKLLFKMSVGTFRVVTGEIVKQNPDAFGLKTPLAALGIRGTEPFIIIDEEGETIGIIDIEPGHVVEVKTRKTSVLFNKSGFYASVSPDGSMTAPAQTSPDITKKVMKAAPITSHGELGTIGTKEEKKKKVDAFKKHIQREKSDLGGGPKGGGSGGSGGHNGHHDDDDEWHPNYKKIHKISIQKQGLKNAENEQQGRSSESQSDPVSDDHDDGHHDDHDDGGDGGGGNGH